jgi:PAS domain S-box-containing protein
MTQDVIQAQQVDYHAAFKHVPGSAILMTPEFAILDVSDDFVELTGRELDEVAGRSFFDVFPANPHTSENSGRQELCEALLEAARTGERIIRKPSQYDVEDPGRPGVFEERYWFGIITPILAHDGQVTMIALWGSDVTPVITQLRAQVAALLDFTASGR